MKAHEDPESLLLTGWVLRYWNTKQIKDSYGAVWNQAVSYYRRITSYREPCPPAAVLYTSLLVRACTTTSLGRSLPKYPYVCWQPSYFGLEDPSATHVMSNLPKTRQWVRTTWETRRPQCSIQIDWNRIDILCYKLPLQFQHMSTKIAAKTSTAWAKQADSPSETTPPQKNIKRPSIASHLKVRGINREVRRGAGDSINRYII
jgi:hypothetical protein